MMMLFVLVPVIRMESTRGESCKNADDFGEPSLALFTFSGTCGVKTGQSLLVTSIES